MKGLSIIIERFFMKAQRVVLWGVLLVLMMGLTHCKSRIDLAKDLNYKTDYNHSSIKEALSQPSGDIFKGEFDEPMAEIRIPEVVLSEIIKKKLLSAKSDQDRPFIKKLESLKLSPFDQSITIKGEFEVPSHLIPFFDSKLDSELTEPSYSFQITLIPSVRVLEDHNFLSIKCKSFQFAGVELIELFPLVSQFIVTALAHSELGDVVRNKTGELDQKVSGSKISLRLHEYYENKNIEILEELKTIRIELEPSKIIQFAGYEGLPMTNQFLKSLRFWSFLPMNLQGSPLQIFYIAVGMGRPSSKWVSSLQTKINKQVDQLMGDMQDELAELTNFSEIEKSLKEQLEQRLADFNIKNLTGHEQGESADFLIYLMQEIRKRLSDQNSLFLPSPRTEYKKLMEEIDVKLTLFSETINTRRRVEEESLKGANDNQNPWPMLIQQVSQRSLSQLVRQLRDIKVEGKYLFRDLDLTLNPALPGIKVHGRLHIDLNDVLPSHLKRNDGNPFSMHEHLMGDSVPFSLTMMIHYLPGGWLRFELKEGDLFDKEQKISFKKYDPAGHFLLKIMQLGVTKSLLKYTFSLPTNKEAERIQKQKENHIADIKNKLLEMVRVENHKLNQATIGHKILYLLLKNNSYNNVYDVPIKTQKSIKHKLSEFIKYEEGAILTKIDPSIFAPTFFTEDKDIQIWNLGAHHSPNLKTNFLELAMGSGPRSQTFFDYLLKSRNVNRAASNDPPPESPLLPTDNHSSGKIDLRTFLGVENVNSLISIIVKDLQEKTDKAVEEQMTKPEEQRHVRVNSLSLVPRADGALVLKGVISLIEKVKREIYNPKRWFSTKYYRTTDTITIQFDMFMRRVPVADLLKNKIDLRPNEVLFGDEALVMDLSRSVIKTGKYKVLLKIIKVLDIATLKMLSLKDLVKNIAFKTFASTLDDKENEGNTVVGDFRLNRIMKVLLIDEELIIIINPKLLTRHMEVAPTGGKEGVFIYPDWGLVQMDYSTRLGLTNIDQIRLSEIINQMEQLFRPLKEGKTTAREILTKDHIWQSLFISESAGKPSLHRQWLEVFNHYPEIKSEKVTECGLELMMFASTAYVFSEQVALLEKHFAKEEIKDEQLILRMQEFTAMKARIHKEVIHPLKIRFAGSFAKKNEHIVNRTPTDWNYLFYKDAYFAMQLYKVLTGKL